MTGQSVWAFRVVLIATVAAIMGGIWWLLQGLGLPMSLVFASLGHTFELNPLLSILAAAIILTAMTLLPWYLSRRRHSRLARWLHLDTHPETPNE